MPSGMLFLLASLLAEGGGGTGWTLNPPLRSEGHYGAAVDLTIFRLHIAGVSSLIGGSNLLIAILVGRGSLTFESPVSFVWTLIITTFLLVLRLSVLACGLTMLLFD
jgi:heme/copper-type cytochrome/quinol oxidase subunit 1